MGKLREKDPSSPVAYHLEGLLEALDSIRALVVKLGEGSASDPAVTAETMTYLQVEIYDHLAYHLKELRRPLRHLVSESYRDLPDIGEAEDLERLRLLASQRQSELNAVWDASSEEDLSGEALSIAEHSPG